MACVSSPDGEQFCDGDYQGFCSREKSLRHFPGIVSFTATSRIVASGPCDKCRTEITLTLYTPPIV